MGDPILFQHLFFQVLLINLSLPILATNIKFTQKTKDQIKIFNFYSFYSKFKEYYPNYKLPSTEFLEWFVGFTEGEGSFTLAKRGDLAFIVTQSSSDINSLNYIKDNLGFGRVVIQSTKQNTHRFVVQDVKNLTLICLIFNGALWLGTSQEWCLRLSNSGDLLKLLIPSNIRNTVCGWINYSCEVISQRMIEKEMDNRGSKSVISSTLGEIIGKEQRVHGNRTINSVLRCTLMGYVSRYQTSIPSKQINTQTRSYTSFDRVNFKLHPWGILL